MVPPAESICILAGMLPLIAGYFQFNFFPVAIGCFLIGLLWLFSQGRPWVWVAPLGLSVFVIAAGLGVAGGRACAAPVVVDCCSYLRLARLSASQSCE